MALHIDYLASPLELVERMGVVQRLVRGARVSGLTETDYTLVMKALEEAGLPAAKSRPTGATLGNLLLIQRGVRLRGKGFADVELVYETGLNQFQEIDNLAFGAVMHSVEAAVNQVTTSKDIDGNRISLAHTWPSTDQKRKGTTDTIGATVSVVESQLVLRFRYHKITRFPSLIVAEMQDGVNDRTLLGKGERQWKCVDCSAAPLDGSTGTWVFEFALQHNRDTWDPEAVFEDPDTNKPVPDPVQGVGVKRPLIHRAVNFEGVLGARLIGG